jgi:DNA-binding transcriptional LysR family regulator
VNRQDTPTNLSNVDLDLFVVLHAVLEEGSATRAAARLHVTRPAVSNAIARLRRVLNDPLVVRTARGLVPTPRAKRIAPLVTSALDQLRAVVDDAATFDPRTSTRRFSIACSDNEQIAILPAVIEAFGRQLPLASLRIMNVDQILANDAFATGDVDVLIGTLPFVPASLRAQVLFTDRIVCIARKGHPAVRRGRIERERLWELPHVDVALLASRPTFGGQLREKIQASQGRTRRVALTVPNFVSAALSVSRTDWLAGVPSTLAAALSALLPLQIIELPFEVPPIPTHLVWHARSDTDPGAVLMRDLITTSARKVGTSARRSRIPRAS